MGVVAVRTRGVESILVGVNLLARLRPLVAVASKATSHDDKKKRRGRRGQTAGRGMRKKHVTSSWEASDNEATQLRYLIVLIFQFTSAFVFFFFEKR